VRDEGKFSIWDINQQKRLHQFKTASEHGPLAIAPDGKTIAALNEDGILTLWDSATGKQKSATNEFRGYLSYLQFSPDGKMLGSYGTYHAYRVWDVETLQEKQIFGRPEKYEFAMAFSSNSKLAAMTHGDGYMRIWDLQSKKEVSTSALD